MTGLIINSSLLHKTDLRVVLGLRGVRLGPGPLLEPERAQGAHLSGTTWRAKIREVGAPNSKLGRRGRSTEARFMVEITSFSPSPSFSLSFRGRSPGRDFRRGWGRRRNRWVAGARVGAKKSAVEVFSALKNPQLERRKRERCISGRTYHKF